MNLRDAILQIDRLKPNKFSDEDKAMWLSELDGKIYHEIVETHQRPAMLMKMATFEPYISGRDDTRELLAPAPHDVVYRWWLECQIDIGNNEIARYNNSRTMFASAYAELQAWWNRMYMPVSPVHAFSYDDHPHHHHHEHEHIHKDECEIEARDIEYALGYVPERQGEAQAAREALEELIDGEAAVRAAGDTNTLIEAKQYADNKVLDAKAELEGEQGSALEEYKAQVDASLQGIAANAATALSRAHAAGNKADTATSTANEAKSAAVSAAGQAAASMEQARQAASAASGAAADAQAANTDAASAALRADMAQAAAQRAETAAKEAASEARSASASAGIAASSAEEVRQAWKSGWLNGKDGYTPVKGVDYFDGAPGEEYDDSEIKADIAQLETLLLQIKVLIEEGHVDELTCAKIDQLIVEYFESKTVAEVEK